MDLDLVTLSGRLTRREVSAVEVIEDCLERIEQVDPAINAFAHVDIERARDQAKASDARKHRLGPLDGIPIAAKENIDIEGLVTRSGLGPRAERPAKRDAEIIARLRAAGAIILGHTRMHEGALGATNDNPHSGRTHNPWRHGHTPGGSSGGSAAAVAARLCPLALGTDTMGSVRLPAAYCGIAGYKPGHGQIDNAGIEPLCREMDQVGPIGRSVADLRFWYEAITNSKVDDVDLRALRIARLANVAKADIADDVAEAFKSVLRRLDRAGVQVSARTIDGHDPGRVRRAGLLLIEAEAAEHFQDDRERYPTAFSESFTKLLDYGADVSSERLADARKNIERVRNGFDALIDTVDMLLMPTTPQTAFSFDAPIPSNQADLTALANFAAAPAVSLPIALSRDGLPIGLQVIGRCGADAMVLAAAAALEVMLDFRLPELPHGPHT
ncbi:MAG: amidase [Alphaproteobacteria bacterium]|nr:amidase [Alphaproteobacteria bacterium]